MEKQGFSLLKQRELKCLLIEELKVTMSFLSEIGDIAHSVIESVIRGHRFKLICNKNIKAMKRNVFTTGFVTRGSALAVMVKKCFQEHGGPNVARF